MTYPKPILGTAMWGWTTPRETCFQLLDEFYQQGFREIDGATNYPINKNPDDWRKAEKILQEWIQTHGVDDLKVMMKVGSLNNLKTPDHNLSSSFLLLNFDAYQSSLGKNLDTYMIHWDNREDKNAVSETLKTLESIHNQGFRIGLSGIKHPKIYEELSKDFELNFRIQIKHNLLHTDYKKYQYFHGHRRFITYGINAGGIKLNTKNYPVNSSLKARAKDWQPPSNILNKAEKAIRFANENTNRPPLSSFNHLGMIYAFYHPDIEGILLGTSRIQQLKESLDFMKIMAEYDFTAIFSYLKN